MVVQQRSGKSSSCWISLALVCLSFSAVVYSEVSPSIQCSPTFQIECDSAAKYIESKSALSPTPFLRLRAGAFSQNDSPESDGRNGNRKKNDEESASESNTNDSTVEEYVAAMRERDEGQEQPQDGDKDSSSSNGTSSTATLTKQEKGSPTTTSATLDPSVVGLKSLKKSNAVGDPDGDDDDDDEDDDTEDETEEEEEETEYSEEWEEIEESYDQISDLYEPQVEVEVELVEEQTIVDRREPRRKGSGGGVGVRLGRIANRRKHPKQRKTTSPKSSSHDAARLLHAWNPFVYFPPSKPGLQFLSDHARILDASSKNRLDRRTLYAGLLLEWGVADSKLSSTTRRFLPASSSQALQAALSMATQPLWRMSAPRTNGIRLYHDNESKGSTLGMQETVAMALVSRFLDR